MIDLKHFRLDDRLVHGQIVTAWVNSTHCDMIIVADDKAANDSLSKTLFAMAVPPSIKLVVETVDGACSYLESEASGHALLLVGNLDAARRIFKKVPRISSLNIGNISNNPERKQYSKSVWLTPAEVETINELKTFKVELYIQVVPSEKKYDIGEVLK